MRLSEQLKNIYTSGDSFTVLQLLKKLIDDVEKVEVDTVSLYVHSVQLRFNGPVGTVQFLSSKQTAFDSLNDLEPELMLPLTKPISETQINYYYKDLGDVMCVIITNESFNTYHASEIISDIVTEL